MREMQASLERLRADAAEAALVRDLCTDPAKREMYATLADHLAALAAEVERATAAHGRPEQSPSAG